MKVSQIRRAFDKLGYKLKIIGEGSDRENLEKMAMNNIEFKKEGKV